MNLAPIRYAQAGASQGGPIEKIVISKIRIGGETYYQANAWLSGRLGMDRAALDIFSMASGTGTDRSALLARYKAISESLERWAYQHLINSDQTRLYGLEIEPSTTGMAAFPGLFAWQSRKRAKLEAIERYCINAWWHGRLDAICEQNGDRHIIQIENPLSSDRVILTWKRYMEDLYAYGTAAARTVRTAAHQALIEMERSAVALMHYRKNRPDLAGETVRAIRNYGERQILFYSLPEGHAIFREHLGSRPSRQDRTRPSPVIDCRIPGPWQAYATVWRVLFPMATDNSDGSLESNFLY